MGLLLLSAGHKRVVPHPNKQPRRNFLPQAASKPILICLSRRLKLIDRPQIPELQKHRRIAALEHQPPLTPSRLQRLTGAAYHSSLGIFDREIDL